MEKKKLTKLKRNALRILVISLIVFFGMIFIFYENISPPPLINKDQIPAIFLIKYPKEFNYRQGLNDCGPFNTAAVVRILKGEPIDSQEFAKKIQWRLPNKYTLPWGLEKQLEENNIEIKSPNLKSLSDKDRILFLQEQISLRKPVILLGEKDNYQHYVTIFGFDANKNEFYIYDSFQEGNPLIKTLTTDENRDLPGNTTLSSEDLIEFWRGGGMYGLYKWYAIVASVENTKNTNPRDPQEAKEPHKTYK